MTDVTALESTGPHPQGPAHAAATSPLRKVARWVLIVGTVLAVAASFGPVWVVRAGVVIALVAAVVAATYAWREVAAARRDGDRALWKATQHHHATLTAERRHNGEVVDVLTTRVEQAKAQVGRVTAELAERRTEVGTLKITVSTLRGDLASLRLDLGQRDATIESLRDTVAAREAELRVLHDEGPDAEVHAWPRRIWTEPTLVLAPPADGETTGDLPAVADLAMAELLRAELRVVDGPLPSVPNYEPQAHQA